MLLDRLATVKHYLYHGIKSFHLHGIHSPFVFQFEKKCLRDGFDYPDYRKLSRFRESVTNNNRVLHIEDHGAGSKVFKSDSRATSDILKHNSSDQKTAELFYRIGRYFKPECILELGTSLGIVTQALAVARPEARIDTIEGAPEIADYTRQNFAHHNLNSVQVISGTFIDFLDGTLDRQPQEQYDLIYLDGHHDGNATLQYFEKLLAFAHKDTVFVLDDIYWSTDMTNAWNTLCQHPRVTASIDIFHLGFLFLREEQQQQRFHIKL